MTAKGQHTIFRDYRSGLLYIGSASEGGEIIQDSTDESLTRAAPALLEALRETTAALALAAQGVTSISSWDETLDEARAAIRLATNEE